MNLIKPQKLAPEILALFDQWAVPQTEYTRELFTYANVLAQSPDERRIGDMVVLFGLASREEVERHARSKPANVMMLEHLVEKVDNIRANTQRLLASNDNLAFYDTLSGINVHPSLHNNEALRKFCTHLNCLPLIGHTKDVIRLVFTEYANLKEYRERARIARMSDPIGVLCTNEELSLVFGIADRTQLVNCLFNKESESSNVAADQEDQVSVWAPGDAETDNQRLLARMLAEAVTKKASNIKFTPLPNGTVEIRYRRHGRLREFDTIRPLAPEQAEEILRFLHSRTAAHYTSTGKRVEGRLLEPADGNLVFRTGNSETFLRCGFIPAGNDSLALQRESVSLRLMDRSAITIRLDALNIAQPVIDEIRTQIQQKHGLILIVGPTSSGKSTTVAGIVSAYRDIYGNTKNLMSLEQPIERVLEGITQVQVAQSSFEAYMAALLRHDPNFISVGEIRDRPSASTCVRASNTGQIVVSTLHADDATLAPNALLAYISNTLGSSAASVIVTPYDAINALSLIVAQRLVPELCPRCRNPVERLTQEQVNELITRYKLYCDRNEITPIPNLAGTYAHNPEGCSFCDHEGYIGERPINEVLPVGKNLRRELTNLVNRHQFDNELLAKSRTYTLHEDAMRHVKSGIVSLADALI